MTRARSPRNRRSTRDGGFERLDGFLLNAVPDEQDLRDYPYEPGLIQLKQRIPPPSAPMVLDQGSEGACTGFGLAAVINHLLVARGEERRVSARMLYEMAKKFDEWEGEGYAGSSCRGAVRGWNNMGVCSDKLAPYRDGQEVWQLTVRQAKDARVTTLGAYYRVRKRISDYHAALNEVGVLYASAHVHKGWERSNIVDGTIPHRQDRLGGHAFAIVGYNGTGFYVQNSWGPDWGERGIALWLYEDWLDNVRDAWVLRLALSTPQIWHLGPSARENEAERERLLPRKPNRSEITGHFVHIDDGDFDDRGSYWTNLATVQETAKLVAKSTDYDHLLFYAHGGLNSVDASARRIAAMKEVFKKNRIYPFHFMYDTGLLEEIEDVVRRKMDQIADRTRGISDLTDRLIEKAARLPGRAIWREMKRGALSPFNEGMAGIQSIRAFLDAFGDLNASPKKVHLVGHSTGAILLAALLEALKKTLPRDGGQLLLVPTCALLAPACTLDTFANAYLPLLDRSASPLRIGRLVIYNLSEDLELRDTVTPLYRKSLLYLVSNSFEEQRGEPILGMQKFGSLLDSVANRTNFTIEVSDGAEPCGNGTNTASTTHGGFDNDPCTMNGILKAILGATPAHLFNNDNLRY